MSSKDSMKRIVDPKQAMWFKLPTSGHVLRTLDENGVVHVTGENPGFRDGFYCVCLGLRVGERGPIRYGTPDSPREGDYFYAEVQESGLFDIYLKAQNFAKKTVTIEWWAIPEAIGGTLGPTPTVGPLGLTLIRFKAKDFPGRYVAEVPGIGPFIRCLTRARMKSLATLASADASHVARILNISDVRAMGFIYQARLLLQGKTRK